MSATELENRESVQQPVRELWCGRCGYGAVVRRDPPECPMCRRTSWRERAPWARHN
jgi:rubrerythrin